MRSGSAMDLVSQEMTAGNLKVEEDSGELPMDQPLPSPLAEIAAHTDSGRSRASQIAQRPKPRTRRPAAGSRRMPRRSNRRPVSPGEVVVGTLAGINDGGQPLVRHPLDPSGRVMLARTTVPITSEQVEREVVLAFESGDIARPIVLGVLSGLDGQDPAEPVTAPPTVRRADRPGDPRRRATGPHRRERDRSSMRQGEPHPDPCGEGPDPGHLPAEPLLGRQPHQGRIGPAQLTIPIDLSYIRVAGIA